VSPGGAADELFTLPYAECEGQRTRGERAASALRAVETARACHLRSRAVLRPASPETYLAICWSCLGEFDALSAVWCSHDPKNPTKLCPFCLTCFCQASETYKQEFWSRAPRRLHDELLVLGKSKDRLGDILIRMGRLTTPQLLEALVEQKETGRRLGEILAARGMVPAEEIQAALQTQGVRPLTDTQSAGDSSTAVWEKSDPDEAIQYLLNLAARKGASDVHIEPGEDRVSVKYRIDGSFFRVEPIPKAFQPALTRALFEVFGLDPAREHAPQTKRTFSRLGDADYELVAQALPTAHGTSAAVKLVNRTTFLKDFTALGLELEDRVRLMEQLGNPFGLVLVSAPPFNGANTTTYSIMSFLVRGQRELVSLESPVYWPLEGARQVEVPVDGERPGSGMLEALRSVVAIRPDVLMLSSVPDRGVAQVAAQLASSVLVVAALSAQSAARAVRAFLELGTSPRALSTTLAAVTCQRLVRRICTACRQATEPPAAQTLAHHGIAAEEAPSLRFFRGKGCPECNNVGYRGRRAIFEVLGGTDEVRAAVAADLGPDEIEAMAVGSGMGSLRERCLTLVTEGITTFDEFTRLRL
jgi:type II secretory ATPase GspE/PulE/Tfp pilus assembly ATPase PilB-like protein